MPTEMTKKLKRALDWWAKGLEKPVPIDIAEALFEAKAIRLNEDEQHYELSRKGRRLMREAGYESPCGYPWLWRKAADAD